MTEITLTYYLIYALPLNSYNNIYRWDVWKCVLKLDDNTTVFKTVE